MLSGFWIHISQQSLELEDAMQKELWIVSFVPICPNNVSVLESAAFVKAHTEQRKTQFLFKIQDYFPLSCKLISRAFRNSYPDPK